MTRALCVLCVAAVLAFQGVQAAPVGEQEASEEEVNVLMFGVLQFSDSLRYTYQLTEARLARLTRAIRSTEGLLRQLDRQTLEAKQAEVQIKEGIHLLQAQTADLKTTAQQTKGKVEQVEQEELEIKTKLSGLNSIFKKASPDSVKSLKEAVQRHSMLLKDLLDRTQEQKGILQLQNLHLTKLQKQNGS
ncbi:uncharacterized protein angptl8 isoform X2 [Clupea harengus]|uniref:Uncharacterized protein angptl8 isoform X2 n=1 Tax=Clupea harengus TaxID=7950 RepID=A0A8M1KQH9_CLUHA|nr:uncharacterized protein angptl8 isoform X2 [Clupea harengus]